VQFNQRFFMSRGVLTAIVLSVGVASTHAEEKTFETGLCFYELNDGDTARASWSDIVKSFNARLDKAQQLNIFTDACYDGAAIDAASDATNGLKMPFVLGTAATSTGKMKMGWSSDDLDPARRLQGLDDDYWYGMTAYVAKRLYAGPKPTVKQVFDAAKTDVVADPDLHQTPQYFKSAGADDAFKIDQGTKSSHALQFTGDIEELWLIPSREQFKAARQLGYNSATFYAHNKTQQNLPEGGQLSGPGTYANFKTALANLQTALNAHPGEETASLFLTAHGYRKPKNVTKKPDAAPQQPKQGHLSTGSDPSSQYLDVDLDSTFWTDFTEEVTTDVPDLVRPHSPAFSLAVSELTLSGSLSVSIGDGGTFLPLGTFALGDFETAPGSTAGYLSVDLTDAQIAAIAGTFGGFSSLTLHFDLAPGDSFRLALEDDLFYDPTYFPATDGVGLATSVQSVPEPGAGTLLLTILLTARRRAGERVACSRGTPREHA